MWSCLYCIYIYVPLRILVCLDFSSFKPSARLFCTINTEVHVLGVRSQGVNNYDIDLVIPEYYGFGNRRMKLQLKFWTEINISLISNTIYITIYLYLHNHTRGWWTHVCCNFGRIYYFICLLRLTCSVAFITQDNFTTVWLCQYKQSNPERFGQNKPLLKHENTLLGIYGAFYIINIYYYHHST